MQVATNKKKKKNILYKNNIYMHTDAKVICINFNSIAPKYMYVMLHYSTYLLSGSLL